MTKEELKQICVDDWIEVSLMGSKKYYVNLGYKILRKNSKNFFKIHPWDLPPKSERVIDIRCLSCLKKSSIARYSLEKRSSKSYKLCHKCIVSLIGKRNLLSLVGEKFGELTVLERVDNDGRFIKYKCKCTCGKTIEVRSDDLKKSNTNRSCGCLSANNFREIVIQVHRNLGHFIKKDHSEDEIQEHLKKQAIKNKTIMEFNQYIKFKREYLCYFTCKNEWGNIDLHHIQSRNKYPHLTHDLNNLICLRKDIHKLFHQLYGYGDNNASQFYEFLCSYARR